MERRRHGTLRVPRFAVVAVVLFAGIAGLSASALAGPNSDNSYTSPNFGYSIAWPMPWYVSSESNDGTYDTLLLRDDASFVQLSGARLPNDSLQQVLESNVDSYRTDLSSGNFEQLPAGDCAYPTDGLVACYRFDATFSDGSVNTLSALFEARSLGEGVTLVTIALVPETLFAEYLPKWQGIVVAGPGEPVPTPVTGNDWEVIEIGSADYRIEPGVMALDRDLAIEGVELARRTVQAMAGPLSTDRLTVSVLNRQASSDPYQFGLARDSAIFIYTGAEGWSKVAPIERIQGILHEYFHLYQFDRLERVDTRVPAWFLEGSADAFGYLVASQLGVTDQMDFVRLALLRTRQFPISSTLCSHVFDDDSMTVDVYPVAYLAVQQLLAASGRSTEALVQIFEAIGNGATFEAAFADTFETDPVQFCTDVETWRATLAPVDETPPDLIVTAGQDLPSAVDVTDAPAQATPGQQVLFTASTAPGANCQLELTPGKRSGTIIEETFANGSGEVFWLVIVPTGAQPGEATVEISCGSGVVRYPLSIT